MRAQRPVYVDLMPPCNDACPAGENIQGWLEHARSGRWRDAWLTLTRDNPFPAVHGRVCYHPCEDKCNRAELDSAVSIHAVERYLGDRAAQEGWKLPIEAPPSGKRVLVVGAGPSGLSAAYHLARLGHAVPAGRLGDAHAGLRFLDDRLERERTGVLIVGNSDRERDRLGFRDALDVQRAGTLQDLFGELEQPVGHDVGEERHLEALRPDP